MATVFKRTRSKPIPAGAEIVDLKGKPHASWICRKSKRKVRAPLDASGKRIQVEDPYYTIEWTDHNGQPRKKSSRSRDKQTAQRIANKLQEECAQRRGKLVNPVQERLTQQGQRFIESHLVDFEAKMRAGDRDEQHVTTTLGYIRKIAAHNAWQMAAEINSDGAHRYVGTLRERGSSNRTVQAYLTAIKSFTKWLAQNHKLPFDPLADVQKPTPRTDRRMERRILEHGEWDCLRNVVAESAESYGMSGVERVLLYGVAVQTGLRAGELREMNRGHLYLDSDTPFIRAKAAITKNSKDARQFLSPDMAAALAAHVEGKAPNAPVFNMPGQKGDVAAMLRTDVAKARSAWLTTAARDPDERMRREQSDFLQVRNHKGEVLDFHALRHSCGAWYVEAGASPKEVQTLMRHATITLTMDTYGHLFRGQESETVKKLRPLLAHGPTPGEPSGQCAKTREGPPSPGGAASNAGRPDDLETSNPIRYNHFDVDRCCQPACAADRRSARRVRELASSLTRNQVPRKGLWVRIPCPPLSHNA